MALELSAIVGIALMSIGSIMVLWGLLLCYTTKVTFLSWMLVEMYRYLIFVLLCKIITTRVKFHFGMCCQYSSVLSNQ